MKNKLISVVVPCYNAEKVIDRCIASLVRQTIGIENMELIFVNDASSDGTIDSLKKWEVAYPESIIVIDCRENHRTGGARNIGIRKASAKYIGFMDNDDEIEPDMYELMYNAAEKHGCEVVSCLYERVSEDGEVYPFDMPEGKKEIPVLMTQEGTDGVAKLPGEVWSKIFLKSMIIDNELYFVENLNYSENYWGPILYYYIKKYYVVDKVLYHHIVNYNSILLSDSFEMHKDRLQVELLKLEELNRRGLCDIYSERIEYDFIFSYYINTLHLWFDRNAVLDCEVIRDMQREINKRYPNYLNNPLIKDVCSNPSFVFMLATIDEEFTDEQWLMIKQLFNEKQFGCGIMPNGKTVEEYYSKIWYMFDDFFEFRYKMTCIMWKDILDIETEISNVNSDKMSVWLRYRKKFSELAEEDADLEKLMIDTICGWKPVDRGVLTGFIASTKEESIERDILEIKEYLCRRITSYKNIKQHFARYIDV